MAIRKTLADPIADCRSQMSLKGVVLILALCLIMPAAVLAQTGAGGIQGTVKDVSGAAVPSATVAIRHLDTGNTFNTQSNGVGFFVFPSIQRGRYRVTADAPGLETWQGDLELQTGQEAVVSPVLNVGGTATQITVAGDVTPVITTTSASISSTVERARIEELPLNGRLIQNLIATTTPGLETSSVGYTSPRPYGLRDGSVQFMQDGVSINNANTAQITTRPPGIDTIQEYRMEMSVPSAKYSSPVTATLSTRSGTNRWHGALFYTGRNNGFGVARQRQDFYTKPPQFIRNEYGASVGGPVRLPHLYDGKDRTFFFFSWEGRTTRRNITVSTSVPTMEMRRGDFSKLTTGAGLPITLYDPWSTAGKEQNYARIPFSGNIVPLNRRSPFAAYYYSVLPQPTELGVNPSMASNWFGPDLPGSGGRVHDDTYTWRLDHRIGSRDQVFARMTIGRNSDFYRNGNQPGPISLDKLWNAFSSDEDMRSGAFSWNHIFSPALFMETVVTGASMDQRSGYLVPSVNENLSLKLGFPNPFNINGAANVNNMGWSLRAIGAIPRAENTKPISGEQNYTVVRGKHQFEAGWKLLRMMLDVLPDRPGAGQILFDSQATGLYDPATGTAYGGLPRTGDNAANFFLGVASTYSQTLPMTNFALRSTQLSGYVQDVWRVTGNLTLNLGLRYDYFQPLIDQNGTNAVFDFANRAIARKAGVNDLIRIGATTQNFVDAYTKLGVKFETAKEAGLPDGLVNLSQRNFSPRIGFAYHRRAGKRAFVVRGGYGEYRFPLETRLYNTQRANAPLQGVVSYNINAAAQSPDGFANWGLRSVPAVIAGTQTAVNALTASAVSTIPRGISANTFAPKLYTSLAREWNLTFETEIMRNTLFRVAYIGTAGRHLDQEVQYNGQPSNFVWYVTTGLPLPTGPYAPVARRDYDTTTYGQINVYSTTGYSNYNGLQVELQRRFNNGLGFQWYYVMSNALSVGSGGQLIASTVPDPIAYMPGSVPAGFDALNRFLNYSRDAAVPKHRVSWNALYNLPLGKGRKWLSSSRGLLNHVAGGWQLAASSSMVSRYITLPTNNWGPTDLIQIYGKDIPVQDCRSGRCIDSYLWYNGYISPNQINTHDSAGRCTGVCGIPATYKPSSQPLWPMPANPNPSDPNYSLYGTNFVSIPMKNGPAQRVSYDNGLHPFRNQYIPGPWNWSVSGSLFKVIPLNERFRLRLNMDFFNVLNMPGTPMPNANTGVLSMQNSDNTPRQLQWTLRLQW